MTIIIMLFITISRHIENPGVVRTVYSGIFRLIQRHSAIFSLFQAYWVALRYIEVYLGIIEAYGAIVRNIRNNLSIFRTLAYLEAEASSKACRTCKMMMHIQSPGIVRTIYSSVFKDIKASSEILILIHIQPHSQALN